MNHPRPRILAIDDTPANLLTLGAALEADFDLQVAHSGALGLEMATKAPPDLILLDVMMPEMDGYETCRRIMAAESLRTIPVIFITALAERDAESAGLALGAADYIVKPINVDIARARIRNLLERERLRKEVEQHRDRLEALVQARTLSLSIAKEAAEAANRAKSTFLANTSHELRTPLNAIMGMTELALRRASDPKQQEYLARVAKSSQRLLSVVNDLLEISSMEADRFTLETVDFEMGAVLETLRDLTGRDAAEKGLELILEAAPELAGRRLHGDAQRLGQILRHLTDNAIKFTALGRVAASVAIADETPTEVLLRFEVRDTGIGISSDDQRRLFRPFEQADGSLRRQYGGAGLGLALCKRLALAMGGTIGVESGVGTGSVFRFTCRVAKRLDLTDGAPTPLASCAEDELRARCSGALVLVAQDDPIGREISIHLLEAAGLRVDLAADGAAAVELARQTDYALILMDIQMPIMNGIDAAAAIRAIPGRAETPILAMTASVSVADQARCREIGMNGFIAQPIEPGLLFATLLRWLDRRRPDPRA